jgi:translation initiation factor eIF-2B subunit gamma
MNTASQSVALKHSTLQVGLALRTANALSMPVSPDEDNSEKQAVSASLRVGVVLHREKDGHASRANNLYSYMELNRRVISTSTTFNVLVSESDA